MPTIELIKKLREMTNAGISDVKKALEENGDDLDKAANWLREKGVIKAAKKASLVATEGVIAFGTKGNKAILVEVNCQTDFVAMGEMFITLAKEIANVIVNNNVTDVEALNNLPINSELGNTVAIACANATAKCGEKVGVRRFVVIQKQDNEYFEHYIHSNKKIGVLLLVSTNNPTIAHDVALHAAAMNPKFISANDVNQEWLANETKILTEQTIAEGKPKDKAEMIVKGRIKKSLSEVCLLNQSFFKDPSQTIETLLKTANMQIKKYYRYEVGEGIEKAKVDFAQEVAEQMKQH